MSTFVRRGLLVLCGFLFALSIVFLWSADWKIAVGVFLFGWSMNIDNYLRKK